MGGGKLRCVHDLGVVPLGREPRDILGNRALKQGDALRQIADIAAQDVRVVLVQRGAVQPHIAVGRSPSADQRASERGFARP